jgi:hypothetical protein
MSRSTAINLHIERVVIDEAAHRAGPDAVRAALDSQLPALLAAGGVRRDFRPAANAATDAVTACIPNSNRPRQP